MEQWFVPIDHSVSDVRMDRGYDFYRFCGFANGTSWRTKYFLDESTMTLTPCGELAIILPQTIAFLFVLIINVFMIPRGFPRIDIPRVRSVLRWKAFLSFVTVLLLIAMVVEGVIPGKRVKSAIAIEYAIMAIVWGFTTIFWSTAVYNKSWARCRSLNIAGFFASKCFFLVCVNRWIMFGFADIRTLLAFSAALVHITLSIVNVVEWRLKRNLTLESRLDRYHLTTDYSRLDDHSDEGASFFSKLFFCWTYQLIAKGGRHEISELEDVFCLPPSLRVSTIERQMVENSPTFFTDGQHYSIAKSLLSTFGVQYFSLGLLRLCGDAFTFAGPILLHLLVTTFEDPNPRDDSLIFALLMTLCSLASSLFSAHFNYYVQLISLKVRAAAVTAIYDKLMRVPLVEMGRFSSGQIMNFISTDVDRIVNFCNSFHAFWSLPVQLIIALYLLHREIGMAFVAGVAAAVLLIPINKVITGAIGRMSEKMMAAKDERVKMTTEVMRGIRSVKLSAWEPFFYEKISSLRAEELHYLRGRKYLDAICVYLWASAPLLITISILATYTLVFHEKLTAAKIFTSLALVNILIMPLNAFPWVLNGLVEAIVSLKRLEWFFGLHEFDITETYCPSPAEDVLLDVRDGRFYWREGAFAVKGINFTGKKGMIIGLSGEVGCGKSTLLLGLLGETRTQVRNLGVHQRSISEGIAYVGQTPWLSRGTVRDNILTGRPFDPEYYDAVIKACCLGPDIKNMPGGDQYEISDGGETLSGGQRARLALARALYQDNSIYLLDNPFASLDRKVSATIWAEAIEKMLKARGKLVIVCSDDARKLARSDIVFLLNNDGSVRNRGPPSKVLDLDSLIESEEAESGDVYTSSEENVEYVAPSPEEKETGAVRASVYGVYMRATGCCLSAFIIGALVAMQSSKNVADWWLARWTAREEQNFTTDSFSGTEMLNELLLEPRQPDYLEAADWDRSIYFLTVYCAIAGANTIFTLIRSFLFAYGGIVAAKNVHENLLSKLLKGSLTWWDSTPTGRIINRMCSDVYTVDDNLPFQLNILLASLFNMAGTLVITLMGLPILVPVVLILFVIYFFIQRYYRRTTVELKRISSLVLSPLYSHLSDSVSGLPTIRAHRFVNRMVHLLRDRLTDSLRAQFSSLAAAQWLTIRLSLIGVTVVSAVALGAIYQHRIHPVQSGLVGLAITYALSLTSLLNGLLGSFIETEKEMISVERIDQYCENIEEEPEHATVEVDESVPVVIRFDSVCLRYEKLLPLALENVTFTIAPSERLAIIGRTGSGKSSLFQAILRAVPVESGSIEVNHAHIDRLALRQHRKLFGIVPQHPFLFSGTLLENIAVDAADFTEDTVATLCRKANLDGLLERIGGLDGEICEGGKNLSHGEKQVISICRVIVQKPKVVLIDEATAHLDLATHKRMLSLLRESLPGCTLVSIVHNLAGLDQYDRVIEMDSGRISWMGPPEKRHL